MKTDQTKIETADVDRRLQTGEFSDFTIRIGTKLWKVHRTTISTSSDFFHAACSGRFLEGNAHEITLHDEDPEDLARLLFFFYAGEYPYPRLGDNPYEVQTLLDPILETLTGSSGAKDGLSVHTALYSLSQKHDVPFLACLSKNAYRSELEADYSLVDFVTSVHTLYATIPEDEHEMKTWAILEAQKYRALFAQQAAFQDLIKITPDFAADLATKYVGPPTLWCSVCHVYFPVDSKYTCLCGFAGVCGLTSYCGDLERYATDYPCTWCRTRGFANPESVRPASEGCRVIDSVKAAWRG